MRYLVLVFMAMALVAPVVAKQCGDSHRFGTTLVRTGDSERRVLEQAEPDRTVQLENRRGGAAGYRLDFYEYRQTVQVYIRGGQVVRICRVRE